jgi:predicted heme/steroid binding protein
VKQLIILLQPAAAAPRSPPPTWVILVEKFLMVIVAVLVAVLAIVLYDVAYDRDPLARLSGFQLPTIGEKYFTPVSRASTCVVILGSDASQEELAEYNGQDPSKPIYLGYRGKVYDVTAGARHYGPKGAYRFFAGRDATRAFVTGCFKEECLVDNLDGLTPEQVHAN